jgi:D-glycero-D-manno-heptose 1,7-bisphosphate phosphatase
VVPALRPVDAPTGIDAVLCDRDGTLVVDVPYNGDPELVRPRPTVGEGLGRLREAGLPVGIVSNQSGVARGLLTPDDVERVGQRIDELLGPFDVVLWCPHGPSDGCRCRKPAPGMLLDAAARLGVDVRRCALIGDIQADLDAARAAGAWGILVPTAATRPEEVVAAPTRAATFAAAVDLVLSRTSGPAPRGPGARLVGAGTGTTTTGTTATDGKGPP